MSSWILLSSRQEKIVLSGTIYDDFTKKPVEFATVLVYEPGLKVYARNNGRYSVEIPAKGTYTIWVMAPGLARAMSSRSTV